MVLALASVHANSEEEITRDAYFEAVAPFVEEAICGESMRSASGMSKSVCDKEKESIKSYCRKKLSEVIPVKFEPIRENTSNYWSFYSKCIKQQVLKGN
jgi:hypothetical protein